MKLFITIKLVFYFITLAVLSHIILCRVVGGKHFMKKGLALGLLFGIALLLNQLLNDCVDIIGLYLFIASWLFYLMICINLLNSVTLKMLAFLYAAPDQKIYFEDFNKSFNDQDGLLTRLEMMKNNELIEYQNENLRLTTKAFKLLKIVSVIDKIFSIKKF
jgi:hypothetical protein